MLERAITEWRNAWLAEGYREGWVEGFRQGRAERKRADLRRMAAWRFGDATGDAFAALLGESIDLRRLDAIDDLVVDCASADELLRLSDRLLNDRQTSP